MSIYDSIIERQPVEKGWSGDRKYRIRCADGSVYLLRVAAKDRSERFPLVFERMKEAARLGIGMCLPVELGEGPEGVYVIQSWIDGADAESVIPGLPEDEQYAFGLEAGRMLVKLHSLPPPADAVPWQERYGAKIDRKLKMYSQSPIKYDRDEPFLRYIEQNRQLIASRPQSYQHGDYHIGNMMVDRSGKLIIIDFDKDDYGDPWEEFNRIVWCAQAAPAFASGMVDGYFPQGVPMEFWRLLALYISSNILSSLPWAIPFGQEEIDTMRRQAADILFWYEDMKNCVPNWYKRKER